MEAGEQVSAQEESVNITVGIDVGQALDPALRIIIGGETHDLEVEDARALRDTLDALVKVVDEYRKEEED